MTPPHNDEMNDLIRRVLRGSPEPLADEPTEPADSPRAQAARLAGLAPEHAHRLVGDTPQELTADAHDLAAYLGSDQLTDFDGGTREPPPEPPPSMSSLIRGERDAVRDKSASDARHYDHRVNVNPRSNQ